MKTKPPKKNTAFTLVEVVLSLGVVAFAFVPIIGLLPLGLDMSRKAIDATVEAHIAQQLTTQAQQTDFSVLITPAASTNFSSPGATPAPTYYDDLGNTLSSSSGAVYEAGFIVKTINGVPSTGLPGGTTTQKLATVTIYILDITSGRTSQVTDPTMNPDWKMFTVLVPDNGR
jgi:uncharacterized protein (TIGR02598 family)